MKVRFGLLALCALTTVGLISAGLIEVAAAASPVRNGQVNACYKVKGKAKGAMRAVPAGKKCGKGERKLAWNVVGPAGANGQEGARGANGANGATGSSGATGPAGPSNEAALQAKITALTQQVEGLESALQEVTPVVSSLCTQANALPGQINTSLGNALSGLALGGTIPVLLSLTVPSLTPVTSYTCPS